MNDEFIYSPYVDRIFILSRFHSFDEVMAGHARDYEQSEAVLIWDTEEDAHEQDT